MGKSFVVDRTGDRPLSFSGDLLEEASSRVNRGSESNRWHELALYRVDGEEERYVLVINYRTIWQEESDHDTAIVCVSAEDVAAQIRMTIPDEHMIGYPLGGQYEEKQSRLKKDLEARFKIAATEILSSLGPEQI